MVLPDPFGPTRPTSSPSATVSETSSSACTPPKSRATPVTVDQLRPVPRARPRLCGPGVGAVGAGIRRAAARPRCAAAGRRDRAQPVDHDGHEIAASIA